MGKGLGRRAFLQSAAIGAAVITAAPSLAQQADQQAALPPPHPPHQPKPSAKEARLFLSDAEAALVAAILDVVLPADDAGPSGQEAGVLTYLDRELAGAWGNGERLYLAGPWAEGTPQQGYQLPLTPNRLIRLGLADVEGAARAAHNRPFAELAPEQRNDLLTGIDKGDVPLAQVPGKTFMRVLWAAMTEGYLADPAYGGNRDKAVWRMIGFPGGRGGYQDDIERFRDKQFTGEPVSLADLQ